MQLRGALVRDIARAPVGRVRDVLLDPDTLDARWLQVELDTAADTAADTLADGTVLVPAGAASEIAPGELLVPYERALIAAARHAGGATLSETDGADLLRHYGFA